MAGRWGQLPRGGWVLLTLSAAPIALGNRNSEFSVEEAHTFVLSRDSKPKLNALCDNLNAYLHFSTKFLRVSKSDDKERPCHRLVINNSKSEEIIDNRFPHLRSANGISDHHLSVTMVHDGHKVIDPSFSHKVKKLPCFRAKDKGGTWKKFVGNLKVHPFFPHSPPFSTLSCLCARHNLERHMAQGWSFGVLSQMGWPAGLPNWGPIKPELITWEKLQSRPSSAPKKRRSHTSDGSCDFYGGNVWMIARWVNQSDLLKSHFRHWKNCWIWSWTIWAYNSLCNCPF